LDIFVAFVVWAKEELEGFVKLFVSQVFVSKSTLSSVAECVHEARIHSSKVKVCGIYNSEHCKKPVLEPLIRY